MEWSLFHEGVHTNSAFWQGQTAFKYKAFAHFRVYGANIS